MKPAYNLLNDPIFYITVAFFALITTALPAALGQPRFLPLAQTLALFVFLLMAVRQRSIRNAFLIVGLWLGVQLITLVLITWGMDGQTERAVSDGFDYRMAYLEWFYGSSPRPDSFAVQPFNRLVELMGILGGSLISGGLIGVWFLVRAANLAAFGSGVLLVTASNLAVLPLTLPFWALVRIAGAAGCVILLAEPLLTGNWSFAYYWQERRRPLLMALALLLGGILLELLLADLWRSLVRNFVTM